jgi:hypothetical protein
MELLDKKLGEDAEVVVTLVAGKVIVTLTYDAKTEVDGFLDGLKAKYPSIGFAVDVVKAGADAAMA